MKNEDVKSRLSGAYASHKETCTVAPFAFSGGQGMVYYDTKSVPAEAIALVQLTETGKYESFKFDVELGQRVSLVAAKAAEKEIPRTDVSAKKAIRLFGLDGEAPELGRMSTERFLSRISDKSLLASVDVDVLRDKETERFSRALDLFRSKVLNKDAISALKACDNYSWGTYYFYAEDGENGLMRRQAANAYPMFAELLSKNPIFVRRVIQRQLPLNPELAKHLGIEEPALKRFQGKTWSTNGIDIHKLVKAAGEIPPDWFPKNEDDWNSFCILTDTVRRIVGDDLKSIIPNPSDVLYKGAKGNWREFHERCAIAYTETRPPEGTTEEDEARLKSGINWKRLQELGKTDPEALKIEIRNQLSSVGSPQGVRQQDMEDWLYQMHVPNMSKEFLHGASIDTQDMISFIADHVVLPAAGTAVDQKGTLAEIYLGSDQREEARKSAMQILFVPDLEKPGENGKAAPNIFEVVRHFHSQLPAIVEAILPAAERERQEVLQDVADDGWPPMTNEYIAPNGVLIKPLTDPRQLTDEGFRGENQDGTEGLHHCVGGYAGTCRERGHHIISMRELTQTGFKRLSTAEILPIQQGDMTLQIRQHRGKHNGTPPENAQQAFDWYLNEIAAGRILINHDRMMKFRGVNAVVQKNDIEKTCSYDWTDKDNITKAMHAVGRYVHKHITKNVRNVDDFISHPALSNVAYSMDPTIKMTR